MPTTYVQCQQNTPEWLHARCGMITASKIVDVISYNQPSAAVAKELGYKLVRDAVRAGVKGEPGADRLRYLKQVRGERLTGRTTEQYVSKYMYHGSEYETLARGAYIVACDAEVEQVGFAIHPDLPYSGASPDALVNEDGLLEIKCPQIETHLDYLDAGVVPEEYEPQCMWGMEVCERKWCDFMSFHPDAPENLRVFIVRLEYDPERAAELRREVVKFNDEVEASIARLQTRTSPKDAVREALRESVAQDEGYLTDEDIEWAKAEQEKGRPA